MSTPSKINTSIAWEAGDAGALRSPKESAWRSGAVSSKAKLIVPPQGLKLTHTLQDSSEQIFKSDLSVPRSIFNLGRASYYLSALSFEFS